jgi:hypothetical protein
MDTLKINLKEILVRYKKSFSGKIYVEENNDSDILMDVFNISPELKRENRQYWGRELGMCWELLVTKIAELNCSNFKPGLIINGDKPTDLFIGLDAIDTKYRIGSGDSGTLKKFKQYGRLLKDQGYNPVILILRNDNLLSAINACKVGGWQLYIGEDCLTYIKEKTNFDMRNFLLEIKEEFHISRQI